ncbi:hypothetical protein JG688_00011356 [Phytophthora aleatoria]|uniref:ZSWIM1/3 RNaseH-like domain-containing protein n=1 Tax=Phytophthora aleatoria TaxID=2496075 RepID=A0A8J5IMA6_9STRA|nr:hypothetical protein JG688_00011356 [Phytophthora aleatoria]
MIMQFLRRQTGKNVALRDVPNLVSKLKEARRGQTKTEDRLELVLRNFCRGKGNTATIYVNDNKLAQTITFQTQQMRRFFLSLPRSADGGCYPQH